MDFLNRYFQPKIITILLLGFSSGLPRLLIASTLGAWLSDNGVERAAIGLFAYVALPYSFNFVWAPLLDHLKLPILHKLLGRRRSWMIFSQISLMVAITWLGMTNPAIDPAMTAIAAILVAFFSASQDIIIDAYRTEFLEKDQYGEGAAMAVFGYRLGMLVAGAGALYFAESLGWETTYAIMAACMLVGMITVLIAGEPQVARKEVAYTNIKSWIIEAIFEPFHHFITHHQKWWILLLFVALYRMSDGFIGFMATPFMLDIGFDKPTIASVAKLYGFGATIAGTFIGGALLHKLGMFRSLMFFGLCQLITNLTYILLSFVGPEVWALSLAITSDNLAGGMITAAAIAFMMRLCHPDYTATQYALLASLASLASIIMAGAAGWVAEQYGWSVMFIMSGLLGIPSLILLWKLRDDDMLSK